jgi:hypothetical protein
MSFFESIQEMVDRWINTTIADTKDSLDGEGHQEQRTSSRVQAEISSQRKVQRTKKQLKAISEDGSKPIDERISAVHEMIYQMEESDD